MDFPTRPKCNKVGIDWETTSRVTIGERISRRAVVKAEMLRWVYLQQRR